jgi:hypothetical protein
MMVSSIFLFKIDEFFTLTTRSTIKIATRDCHIYIYILFYFEALKKKKKKSLGHMGWPVTWPLGVAKPKLIIFFFFFFTLVFGVG